MTLLVVSSMLLTLMPSIGVSNLETSPVTKVETIVLSQTELLNSLTVGGHLDGDDDTVLYTIQVAPNAVYMRSILTCPSSADFDLYGKVGAPPSTDFYDWRGFSTTGEDVTYGSPFSGTWYIMVHSWDGNGSYELTVTIHYLVLEDEGELEDGITSHSTLTGYSDMEYWSIEVLSNVTSIRTVLTCGGNDFDLYARRNNIPTRSEHDWDSTRVGDEDYTYSNPGSGTWVIMVYAFSGDGSYQITVYLHYDSLPEWTGWLTDLFFSPMVIFSLIGLVCLVGCVKAARRDPQPYSPGREVHEPTWHSHDDLSPLYCMYCGTRMSSCQSTCGECGAILPRTDGSRR